MLVDEEPRLIDLINSRGASLSLMVNRGERLRTETRSWKD